MTLWSARNGFLGMGQVAALVEADTEAEARELAVAAFEAAEIESRTVAGRVLWEPQPDYWVIQSIVPVALPYVGDELP